MIFKCDYFLVLWLCLHANWYNGYYDIHYLNNVNKSMLTQCCIIQKINVWANVWFCYNRLQVRSWRSMKKSTLPWRSKRCNKRTRLRGWRWVQTKLFSGSLMYDKACFACLDFKYIFIGKNKKKRSINKFWCFFSREKTNVWWRITWDSNKKMMTWHMNLWTVNSHWRASLMRYIIYRCILHQLINVKWYWKVNSAKT